MSLPEWWSEEQEADLEEVKAEDKRLRQNLGILEAQVRKTRDAHVVVAKRLDQLQRQRNGEATFPGLE